uniref:G-protein coupled receptors family 1 profile domain-containing protein n=1 Tax=Sus scrofa TaxID=9823 RepID=A0A8D0PHA8_PIG
MIYARNTYLVSTFFLIGIPGLVPCSHLPHGPGGILGNCSILFVIRTEPSLPAPTYHLLSLLAVSDLGLSLSSRPTMLRIFAFSATAIPPNACFAQEFFIHGVTDLESSVLLLIYSSILTNARVAKTGLAFLSKSMLLALRFPFTLKRWTYCRKSLLSHSYCLHQDVMKLACSDNTVSFFYGSFVALCMMTDSGFTAVSCMFILQTVMGTGSHKERLKALNTCVSHICAVLVFYVPIIALASVHRFGRHKPPGAMSLIADIFLLVPPLMNPIVYCVKTRQIREKVLGKLGLK